MALLGRRRSTAASPAPCAACSSAAAAHRDRHGHRSGHPHPRAGEGSTIDLERFVSDFQQSGAAAACPRIMIEPDGFLARFQAFEYALAFRVGRESLADFSITSGVSFYRRNALQRALQEHSLSVYAEDFENAIILLSHGRAYLLRRTAGGEHRGPGHAAALVLAAGRLVPRAAQGLHRALRQDLAHQSALAVRHLSLHRLCRRAVARRCIWSRS